MQKEEIKLKEKLLDEARNESLQALEKEREQHEHQLKKKEVKDARLVHELSQYASKIAKKD